MISTADQKHYEPYRKAGDHEHIANCSQCLEPDREYRRACAAFAIEQMKGYANETRHTLANVENILKGLTVTVEVPDGIIPSSDGPTVRQRAVLRNLERMLENLAADVSEIRKQYWRLETAALDLEHR